MWRGERERTSKQALEIIYATIFARLKRHSNKENLEINDRGPVTCLGFSRLDVRQSAEAPGKTLEHGHTSGLILGEQTAGGNSLLKKRADKT